MKKERAILLLLILCIAIRPVYASQISEKKSELNEANQNIKKSKDQLETTNAQKQQVQSEMDKLDKRIITIENQIMEIENDLAKKEEQLEVTQKDLEEAITKKDHQYDSTKKRMVHMYKNNKVGYLQIVFSSNNFWEMLNRLHYIKVISQHDKQLLTEYEEQEQVIANKKAVLEEEQKEIELLYKKQIGVKAELDDARAEKNKMLGVLDNKAQGLHAKLEEMEEISKDLEKEINRLVAENAKKIAEENARKNKKNTPVKYTGGQFGWPVPGYYSLSSEYNPRESPISGEYEFHQGIDIPAPYGRSVAAAADGVVITAGWVRGFGNTIMIDHGSGIVSIYGHNSSLVASTGQYIKKGEQVARIGSTGYSTGNHCHFEVRVNGRHTSPWNYLN